VRVSVCASVGVHMYACLYVCVCLRVHACAFVYLFECVCTLESSSVCSAIKSCALSSTEGLIKYFAQLQLLNKLNRLGVVEHVVKDHVVKDEYLFYFMNEEKIVNKQNEADPRKNIEETMDMLSKELQVLLVSKRQAVCDEKFAEAAHIQEHIEAMRVRLGEFYEQAISSRESIVEEIAPIIGSSNQDRSSQPKFSPTDFFSVSPESDISASVDSRPRLRRGERITISRIDQLEASKATLVRRKKGYIVPQFSIPVQLRFKTNLCLYIGVASPSSGMFCMMTVDASCMT